MRIHTRSALILYSHLPLFLIIETLLVLHTSEIASTFDKSHLRHNDFQSLIMALAFPIESRGSRSHGLQRFYRAFIRTSTKHTWVMITRSIHFSSVRGSLPWYDASCARGFACLLTQLLLGSPPKNGNGFHVIEHPRSVERHTCKNVKGCLLNVHSVVTFQVMPNRC